MPPDPAGGIFFSLTPAVRQPRVTTIVVVVNIYTYQYYYFTRHFQVPHGILMYAQGRVILLPLQRLLTEFQPVITVTTKTDPSLKRCSTACSSEAA